MKRLNPLRVDVGDEVRIQFLTQPDGSPWPSPVMFYEGLKELGYQADNDCACPACDTDAERKPPKKVIHLNAVEATGKFRQVLKVNPIHKKRRNQSIFYHIRIQKKWDKRSQRDPGFRMRVSEPIYHPQVKLLRVRADFLKGAHELKAKYEQE